jgi:hypothetical protein
MTSIDYTLVAETVTAAATLAVPVVVAVMANRFNNQLKKWEANQWRNQELIKARLEYYKELVPQLNDLMCYLTFIGHWKDITPPAAIEAKRTLDRAFYCAAPLFGEDVLAAYQEFMGNCFHTYGKWGADARLKTGFGRRQEAAGTSWSPGWNDFFTYPAGTDIPVAEIAQIRRSYDAVMSAFARDIELNMPRDRYVNADVTPSAN